MGLFRPLMRLLALAIVWVAASFVPVTAEAHAGHAVEPSHEVEIRPITPHDLVTAVTGGLTSRGLVLAGADTIVVQHGETGFPPTAVTCHGGCCSTGSACCSLAMPPDAAGFCTPARRGQALSWPRDLAHPGITPEALPEPPRSFA
ncbi:hypothetical protein [Chelatococcus reniformis]|uniref:Secreted protein n=1 Tax=Chelatococcus reniformis TaxID=1494448 RepID=A0A916XB54_9HYPH|nr:hypothetical protein [Chelatococcus reniformis]GGC58743.1 hypothetical protein GCM10010994_17010 [Chelatococcus reniformis]